VRRGLLAPAGVAEAAPAPYHVDPRTGLPVVRSKRTVTSEDVRALEDEV
jgi:hypothetical protein